MDPCVPLPLDPTTLSDLSSKASSFALSHGIAFRPPTSKDVDSLTFVPFTLLPSPFPKNAFYSAVSVTSGVNQLMYHVAQDADFLQSTLSTAAAVDPFTRRLCEIHRRVREEGSVQPLSLGLMRNDVMLDGDGFCKQVEINTIASGQGWLGPAAGRLHRYLKQQQGCQAKYIVDIKCQGNSMVGKAWYVLGELDRRDLLDRLPENRALEGLAGAMLEAWTMYGSAKAVILFVVEDVTHHICDQRFHEFEIRRQNPEVFVIRRTLTEIFDQYELVGDDRRLHVDGREVGLVYFRSGYSPEQYPTEDEWTARTDIERSRAIKCPNIQLHLAGTKKVQQVLSKPGVLERFLKDGIEDVREMFAGLYSLDRDEEGQMALEMALESPERFVLKPQREGGGNNVYGEDLRTVLKDLEGSEERGGYILMDRLTPPTTPNYVVRSGQAVAKLAEVVGELGVFGCVIGEGGEVLVNRCVGHTLRTKLGVADEGGVTAGYGALDSVFLV